jgi:O-antigen ligase
MTWLQRAVILVAALSPTYLIRFKIFGVPSTVFELCIVALCLATAVAAYDRKTRDEYLEKLRSIPKSLMVSSVLFFVAGCVSIFVAPSLYAAAGIWRAYIVEAMVFGFIAWLNIKSYVEFRALVLVLSVTAAIAGGYAIVQKFTGWGIPNPFWRAEETRRVTSFFGYPNGIALYVELIIPFLIAGFLLTKKVMLRAWYAIVIIISLLAIAFAQSSGAFAALAITAGLALLFWKKTRWWTAGFGAICIAIILLSPLRKPFADEFLLQGFSGRLRTQMWNETVVMLKSRWIQGAGLAGYQTRVAPYHVFTWAEVYLYPHNLVLTLWSELGMLGLVSFGSIIGLLFFWMVQAFRKGSFESRIWSGVILALLTIILVHGLVDIPYFRNDLAALFWLCVALALQIRYTSISTK